MSVKMDECEVSIGDMMDDGNLSGKSEKKRYFQKFRESWLLEPDFKDWLGRDPNNPLRSYCTICNWGMESKKSSLLKHGKSSKHLEIVKRDGWDGGIPPSQTPKLRFVGGVKIYEQKFRESWLEEPSFRNWLTRDPDVYDKAYCKICSKSLDSKRSNLLKHAVTNTHCSLVGSSKPEPSESNFLDFLHASGGYSMENLSRAVTIEQLTNRLLKHVKLNVTRTASVFVKQEHRNQFLEKAAHVLLELAQSKQPASSKAPWKKANLTNLTRQIDSSSDNGMEPDMIVKQELTSSGVEEVFHVAAMQNGVENSLFEESTHSIQPEPIHQLVKRFKRGGSRKRFTDEEMKARKRLKNKERYDIKAIELRELKEKGERPHQCDVCGRRFYQKATLNIHTKIHLGLREFKCRFCDKAFLQYTTCKQHEVIHTKERAFICELCGKSFSRSCTLHDHKRMHLGVKPYNCQYCGHAFRKAYHLKVHERIHTGEKPICCDICGQSFANPGTFYSHRKRHANVDPNNVLHSNVSQPLKHEEMITLIVSDGQLIHEQQAIGAIGAIGIEEEAQASDALVALGNEIINLNSL